MNKSIDDKRRQIEDWIKHNPDQGHPHYWCGGIETDCDECNIDHPLTPLHLAMWDEEEALLKVSD